MSFDVDSTARHVRRHREMLIVSVVALLLSFLLEVRSDGRVALFFLPELPLPETCASRSWFGTDCPGCGLTRSLIHLAHGRWNESLALHRLGWLLALALCLQFPYRVTGLLSRCSAPLGAAFPRIFAWTLIAVLILNWIAGLTIVGQVSQIARP